MQSSRNTNMSCTFVSVHNGQCMTAILINALGHSHIALDSGNSHSTNTRHPSQFLLQWFGLFNFIGANAHLAGVARRLVYSDSIYF